MEDGFCPDAWYAVRFISEETALTYSKDEGHELEPLLFFCCRQYPLLSLFMCSFTLFWYKLSVFALETDQTFPNMIGMLFLLVATIDAFLLLLESMQRIHLNPAHRKVRAHRKLPYSLPIDYHSRYLLMNWLNIRVPFPLITKANTPVPSLAPTPIVLDIRWHTYRVLVLYVPIFHSF